MLKPRKPSKSMPLKIIGLCLCRVEVNVAISRAQCMAVIVYSQELLNSVPNNIEQITIMNMFCQLVKDQ
ncbi:hypothetical protein Ltuc_1261 [Legionella tucsonensis]|uniref:Uncharacterized protein n=1 Tax=Legionella tucsonensis TaxID=40335 RepID=A0A0W0ZWN4_9GAMM|nr:hypothetical protein Ltuc_1261 [Legionella tucsonensis]